MGLSGCPCGWRRLGCENVEGLCQHRGACWAVLARSEGLALTGPGAGRLLPAWLAAVRAHALPAGAALLPPWPGSHAGCAPVPVPTPVRHGLPSRELCPRSFGDAHLLLTSLPGGQALRFHGVASPLPAPAQARCAEGLQQTALGSKGGEVGISEVHQPADLCFRACLQIITMDGQTEGPS